MDTFEEFYVKIIEKVDMLELLEVLTITVEDIVRGFPDRVEQNKNELEEYLKDEPFGPSDS